MERFLIGEKMGYKTYAHLDDLNTDFVRYPCDETVKASDDYQTLIRWPWSATQEILDEWARRWKDSWTRILDANIDAQKAAGVWPIRTREEAVAFHTKQPA